MQIDFEEYELSNDIIDELIDDDNNEDELKDPSFKCNLKLKKKSMLRLINPKVATAVDRVKTSNVGVFRIISEVLKGLEIDLNDIVFSVSTIRRRRINNRINFFNNLKERIVFPNCLCLHWDGVHIYDESLKIDVEHYVIKATNGEFDQLLAVVRCENRLAETISDEIIKVIKYFEIQNKIKLVNYDTAVVNTGKKGDISVLLEEKFLIKFGM